MKIVYNKIIPFKGFIALNFFGVVFIREEYKDKINMDVTINHEQIHTYQMLDFSFDCFPYWLRILMGGIVFYVLYFLFWLFRLVTPPYDSAYNDISFERETYANEKDLDYCDNREKFNWCNYIKR